VGGDRIIECRLNEVRHRSSNFCFHLYIAGSLGFHFYLIAATVIIAILVCWCGLVAMSPAIKCDGSDQQPEIQDRIEVGRMLLCIAGKVIRRIPPIAFWMLSFREHSSISDIPRKKSFKQLAPAISNKRTTTPFQMKFCWKVNKSGSLRQQKSINATKDVEPQKRPLCG